MVVDIENKNPFNVLMGLLLRFYRIDKKMTSKAMSLKLNAGHSLYRLIEAGSSPLHPSKIFLFIELFEELFDDEDIKYEKLSNFLIAGQYIDSQVNRKQRSTSRGLSYKEAVQEFLEYDTVGFAKLFNNIDRLFNININEKELDHLLNYKAPLELFDFLSKKDYLKDKHEQYDKRIMDLINDSYSLNLEIGIQMFKSLQTLHPSHISTIAAKWEQDNKNNFEYVRGFFIDRELIINKENFKLFDYDYLFEQDFKETQIIFYRETEEETSNSVKEIFFRELNSIRKEIGKTEITKDSLEWEKLKIKLLNKGEENDSIITLVESPKADLNNTTELKGFWFFSMSSGNEIGFAGYKPNDANNDKDYVLNLTLSETNIRKNEFIQIWEKKQ